MLNEMLRRGVTVNDLVTLKPGEIVYLWEKDVATMRELSDYTKKSIKQIQRICRREESILYKGKSKISTAQKTVFGKLKFPARYVIRMDEIRISSSGEKQTWIMFPCELPTGCLARKPSII